MTEPLDAPKRYLLRTFGCQMNEHDSERIAGQFEADGMVEAAGTDDADVIETIKGVGYRFKA